MFKRYFKNTPTFDYFGSIRGSRRLVIIPSKVSKNHRCSNRLIFKEWIYLHHFSCQNHARMNIYAQTMRPKERTTKRWFSCSIRILQLNKVTISIISVWKVLSFRYSVTPSRCADKIWEGKALKPQMTGKSPQILKDRKAWKRSIFQKASIFFEIYFGGNRIKLL